MRAKTLIWRPDTISPEPALIQPQERPPESFHPKRNSKRRTCKGRGGQFKRPRSPKLMEQIRAEGYGRLYVQKQIKKRTPMVLELYGETVEGVIRRRLTYALDVLVGGKQRRIEKIDIKYMYKRNQTPPTAQWIAIDPELKAKNLVSIVRRSERFHIDNKPLARCCRDKTPVRLILRSGEMITGVIDWFSQYEIKIDVMNGKGIVVFRHGLHRCETDPAGNAE